MGEQNLILKGTICYCATPGEITVAKRSYLVCEDGICRGVFEEIPDKYKGMPMTDWEDRLIIPGLTDLHIHAPQYSFRGLGMDLELLDWLNERAFPEEAKFADIEYAGRAYDIFAENLKRGTVTRACIFGTIHREATVKLMDIMEATGLKTMVGKVNMDRNSPDCLREESAKAAAADTVGWLKETIKRYENVRPILTPRFIPSCTDELMGLLGRIQREFDLPVQSHLSENRGGIEWVRELCPDAEFYGDAYDRVGLFGGDCRTVMAHCVYSGREEMERMRQKGVFIAHCPQSNTNLCSGIAPVRKFLSGGLSVGLGSDVAGGTADSIFRAMTDAIQVSKLRWRLVDEGDTPLTVSEAFYMATKGGGAFFGKVGSFEEGYECDAVVLDDSGLPCAMELTSAERLERMFYLSDDRQVVGKYVSGNRIF